MKVVVLVVLNRMNPNHLRHLSRMQTTRHQMEIRWMLLPIPRQCQTKFTGTILLNDTLTMRGVCDFDPLLLRRIDISLETDSKCPENFKQFLKTTIFETRPRIPLLTGIIFYDMHGVPLNRILPKLINQYFATLTLGYPQIY